MTTETEGSRQLNRHKIRRGKEEIDWEPKRKRLATKTIKIGNQNDKDWQQQQNYYATTMVIKTKTS